MVYTFLLLATALFAFSLKWFGVIALAGSSVRQALQAGAVLMAAGVTDDEKEASARRAARALGRDGLHILWRSLAALVVAGAAVCCGAWLGFYSLNDAGTAAVDPLFILSAVLSGVAALVVAR